MGISDWSSEVCSSYLGAEPGAPDEAALLPLAGEGGAQRRMRGGERSELLLLSFLPGRNAKIKSFRAVTARATFLCLCKETWRKESTPRLRARCVAPGSRSRRDFPRGHHDLAGNAAHPDRKSTRLNASD